MLGITKGLTGKRGKIRFYWWVYNCLNLLGLPIQILTLGYLRVNWADTWHYKVIFPMWKEKRCSVSLDR